MTHMLERAIAEVESLPKTEQDALAAIIIEELEEERRWSEQIAASPSKLDQLVAKAMKDIQEGNVHDLGMDEL